MDENVLHIYGQLYQHDSVLIVGDRKGLETLMLALESALQNGYATSDDTFCNDGEGYEIAVKLKDNMENEHLPYSYYR